MIPSLQHSTFESYSWQRLSAAFACSINEWTDEKALGALPAFVADKILTLVTWDRKATLRLRRHDFAVLPNCNYSVTLGTVSIF